MKDLFGDEIIEKSVEINIYSDEIQSKYCPYTKDKWFYIGIIVEDISNSLLDNIVKERFLNNFDKNSNYFSKNNRVVHWSEIRSADTENICKRWFEYILEPEKSEKNFYAYILGINDSKLHKEEFDPKDDFNSKYNRFFRSAILYALKTFFPSKKIIVKNIFHEEGPQKHHKYFPWHCIYKIKEKEDNIEFERNEITFLPKDHEKDKRSNILQLCDVFMGACTSIIHGIEKSKSSKYREKLMDLVSPLVQRMVEEPHNKNSRYKHANRIMIRFFPKEETIIDSIKSLTNQFYTKRRLYYLESKSRQMQLFK